MTDLGCKVKNCAFHNEANLCSRDSIKVDGSTAMDSCSTCCSSYEMSNKRDRATNSCDCKGKQKIDISCEATHCRYNDNYNCVAGHIDVKPSKDKTHGVTECASFVLK